MKLEVLHQDGGLAVLGRDDAVVHVCQAGDESWRERRSLEQPVRSGGETGFGTRAFAALDADGNLLTFFQRVPE